MPISDFGGGEASGGRLFVAVRRSHHPGAVPRFFVVVGAFGVGSTGGRPAADFLDQTRRFLVWIRRSMPAGVFLFVSTTENLPFSVQGYVFAHLCLLRECRFILPRCGSRPLSDTACLSAVQVKIQKWQSSVVNKEQRGNKGALLENDGELSVDKRWRGESCYFQLNCSKNSGRKKCDAVDLSDQ